jgi:hypothetical protein
MVFASGDPHFLQYTKNSPVLGKPHAGQVTRFMIGMGACTSGTAVSSGEPHRLQKRDSRSDCIFPHVRQVRTACGMAAGSFEPHRSQKTELSSRTTAPQLLHCLLMGVFRFLFGADG